METKCYRKDCNETTKKGSILCEKHYWENRAEFDDGPHYALSNSPGSYGYDWGQS